MKSMTGFAKQQTEYNGHKYTIEIKTLNSKTLDLNTKIPASLHNRELEIRTMLNALERGKIDFIITDENTSTNIQLNHELVQSRYQEITALADQLHCTQHNILDTIPQSDILDLGRTAQANPGQKRKQSDHHVGKQPDAKERPKFTKEFIFTRLCYFML